VLLAIDVGNTTTMIGAFSGEKLVARWTLTSGTSRTADEAALTVAGLCAGAGISADSAPRIVIASVVPSLTPVFEGMARKLFKRHALVVTSDTETGIEILYRDPASVGADRIANAVAAWKLYKLPAIVVDLGTATTFDVIAREGKYLGGVIAPGLVTSAENLFARGAKLFPVEFRAPAVVVGRSTEESLLSGIMYGAVGQVDEIVGRIEAELGESTEVIGTGGLVETVAPLTRTIKTVDPALTLHGLRIVAEMNP
jgi:type III pantothenate kinase